MANDLPKINKTPDSYAIPTNFSFQIKTVAVTEVFNLLCTIEISKATGHDRILPKLLKDSADVIAPSLAYIFNQSILTGIFPQDLKTAFISPIFTSGDMTESTNYRLISILYATSKIFEKLISKQLLNYLESNEILTYEQAGFRKNHSTQTSLLRKTNK